MKKKLAWAILIIVGSVLYFSLFWVLPFFDGGDLAMVGYIHLAIFIIACGAVALSWAIVELF